MSTTQEGRAPSVEERLAAMLTPATEDAQEVEAPSEDLVEDYEEQQEADSYESEHEDEFLEDEEGEPASQTDTPDFAPIAIVADGVEYMVQDRDEAIRLLQLGKTFTQRNQALLQQRNELEPLKAELTQQREEYLAALPQLAQLLNQAAGLEPDPTQFVDRNEYLWAKDQWTKQREQLQAVHAEQHRVASEREAELRQRSEAWRANQQNKLFEKLPEWKDQKTAATEAQEIAQYGMAMGLSEEELGSLHDHRFVLVLRDAMRYRNLLNSGKVKARDASKAKTAAPNLNGKKGRDTRSRRQRQQRTRLKKSGRIEDAAPLIAEMMGITK